MKVDAPLSGKILFYAYWLFLFAILSLGISVVVIFFLDWLLYSPPPHLQGRREIKFHTRGAFRRIGWEISLVIFVLTYIATTIYGYLKYQIERDVE